MKLRLFVVHGSHPCAAVQKALELKGLPYKVTEWVPPLHAPLQRLIFGARTVPGLSIRDNGSTERIVGSRAIMHRLDQLAPEPPLYPGDHDRRARVEDADRWGDEEFQAVPRELIWAGFARYPETMISYSENSHLPMPAAIVRLIAPAIAAAGRRLNRTDAEVARRDLDALPAQLDKLDAWIAEGTIGDAEHPNAADLQTLSTLRLLLTIGDARQLIEGRPCEAAARRLFPTADGELPVGTLS